MDTKQTERSNEVEETTEFSPLMEAFNPLPVQAEQPARFYWQEPWQDASADRAVQATFES
jgi:hypothetical protein